jgi:hypothetical protein
MERSRPSTLTTIAVLNIVFGSLGLICGCINGFLVGALLSASRDNPNELMRVLAEARDLLQREIPSYQAVVISRCLYLLVFSSLLIAAGIGLLYIANWARVLSFIYAVTAILSQGAYLVYAILVEHPAAARMQAQFGGDPVQSKASQIGGIAAVGLIIIYAIVLIILLCLPSVTAAFSPRPPDEYYRQDDGYDEYITR